MNEREKTTVLGDDDIILEPDDLVMELREDAPAVLEEPSPVPAERPGSPGDVEVLLAELECCDDPDTSARLHYQIALIWDAAGDLERAMHHAMAAVDAAGQELSYLRCARRLIMASGNPADALPHLDQEIMASPQPSRRADLQVVRGQILEHDLGDTAGARAAYAAAIELKSGHAHALSAAIRCARVERDWHTVSELCTQAADATNESALKAAYLAEHARICDVHFNQSRRAAELYESALKADPAHPGVAAQLDRIYAREEDWPRLAENHRRIAESSADLSERAMRYYLCAHVQRVHLGDRESALTSLYQAIEAAPDSVLILQHLADAHRENGEEEVLAELLRKLLDLADDDASKCALFHSLGQVLEGISGALDDALQCYKGALSIDPTYLPALQALGSQLARLEKWQDLIHMHLAEADSSVDSMRRASAHVRVAEICETRLGSHVDAAAHYERALALVPGHAVAFKALVRLFGRVGEHRKLIELYERAVDVSENPEHKIAYLFKLGALWEDALEDPVQAAHAYRRVLKERPDDLGALHALQRVSELAGHHRELVDYLLREAELSEDEAQTAGLRHRAAVVLDEVLQDTGAATRLLRDILDRDAAYVPALVSLGRIYHRAGRWDDLVEMYRCELEVTDDARARAALLTKMGELCENRLGSAELAADCYRDAFRADASYRPAGRALARILETDEKYAALVDHLQVELEELEDSRSRALLLYRIAEIADTRLGDVDLAIDACERAMAESAEATSPAALLLQNLLARTERWEELDELLARGPAGVDVSVRRAQISRDRMTDTGRSIEHLHLARSSGGGIAALHSLRELLEDDDDREGVAKTLLDLSQELRDRPALASVLRDLEAKSRAQQPPDAVPTRRELLIRLVELEPDDLESLEGLATEARRAGDCDAAIVAYSALAEASSRPDQVADAWLRLALWLESEGDARCGDYFKAAREADSGLLAAVSGMRRAAEAAGDAEGLAVALRGEAELREDSRVAAELLVEAARVQRRAGIGGQQVVDDLSRALDRFPDSEGASELLGRVLSASGEHTALIDVFSRAADRAEAPQARANLCLQIGISYAAQDNHGAAITALRRGLASDPNNAPIQDRLVEIFESQKQWAEAVEVLEQAAGLESHPDRRCDLLLQQGTILGRRLSDAERALSVVEDALSMQPEHREALLLAASLRIDLGYLDEARHSVDALFESADDRVSRAQALSLRAGICERDGDAAGAEAALAEAVGLVGTHTSCYTTLRKSSQKSGNWHAMAGALDSFVRNNPTSDPLDATLALAEVYGVEMRLPGKAVELLRRHSASSPNPQLAAALVRYLGDAGDIKGAQSELIQLLGQSPTQTELWHQLAAVSRRMGDHGRARGSAQALRVLCDLKPEEQGLLTRPGGKEPALAAGAISPGTLRAIAGDAALEAPLARGIACLSEAIGKVYGRDTRQLGLSRGQRFSNQPEHPARRAADKALHLCGPVAELYASSGGDLVSTSLGESPVVIIDDGLGVYAEAAQVFLIARALVLISTGLHPLLALSKEEFAQIAAALRSGAGSELFDSLLKAAPRKRRKQIETASLELGSGVADSPEAWRESVLSAANAVAALACDDLASAAAALRASSESREHAEAAIASLLGIWVSPAATAVAGRIGVLSA